MCFSFSFIDCNTLLWVLFFFSLNIPPTLPPPHNLLYVREVVVTKIFPHPLNLKKKNFRCASPKNKDISQCNHNTFIVEVKVCKHQPEPGH